jgi:hypothetical protein
LVTAIAGGHELHEIRSCLVRVGTKAGSTEERCVEREGGARIAWEIVEDSTGFGRMVTGWRSGFTLAERDGATIVTAHSTFRANDPLVRAMLPLLRRKFHQAQQAILCGLQGGRRGRSRSARGVMARVDEGWLDSHRLALCWSECDAVSCAGRPGLWSSRRSGGLW